MIPGEHLSLQCAITYDAVFRWRIWCGFRGRQLESLKGSSQHGCIFLSVVAVPSFPQCKSVDSTIWNSGFASLACAFARIKSAFKMNNIQRADVHRE